MALRNWLRVTCRSRARRGPRRSRPPARCRAEHLVERRTRPRVVRRARWRAGRSVSSTARRRCVLLAAAAAAASSSSAAAGDSTLGRVGGRGVGEGPAAATAGSPPPETSPPSSARNWSICAAARGCAPRARAPPRRWRRGPRAASNAARCRPARAARCASAHGAGASCLSCMPAASSRHAPAPLAARWPGAARPLATARAAVSARRPPAAARDRLRQLRLPRLGPASPRGRRRSIDGPAGVARGGGVRVPSGLEAGGDGRHQGPVVPARRRRRGRGAPARGEEALTAGGAVSSACSE